MRISWEDQPQIKLVAEAPSQFHPPLLDWDWICRSFPGVSENRNRPFPAMPKKDNFQPGKTWLDTQDVFWEPIFRQTQMGKRHFVVPDGVIYSVAYRRWWRLYVVEPNSPMFLCVLFYGDDCVPISKSIYGKSKRGTCLILLGQSFQQIPIFFQDNIVWCMSCSWRSTKSTRCF